MTSVANGAMTAEELERYADTVVRRCVFLNEGDTLFLQGAVAHREILVAMAEAAYRAGARLVDIDYSEPRGQAARVRHARDEFLGPLGDWRIRLLREHLKPTSAIVTTLGESDPGVFDDLPPERVAEDTMRPLARVPWYVRAVKEGRRRWAGAGWPTAYWARQVYPNLSEAKAVRQLAQDLLWFCRLGPDDPPDGSGWSDHAQTLAERASALSELALAKVELRGPGTELDVRLDDRTRWLGGQRENPEGFMLAPNIPTEESFTSPHPDGTEGTFRCSRPLSFRGRTIEGIAGEFQGGRLVRLEAADEADRDFLAAFIDSAENADRLGEVALVDRSSRIGQKGRVYSNTLIDENAVAHIAFGSGFGMTRTTGARGGRTVNSSTLHLDVMIGSDDFEATGVTAERRRIPLIADGTWQAVRE